jgi:hypothetical protein
MRLQWQAQRTNSLGVVLATIVLFLAVSSFLADTFNVIDRLSSVDQQSWVILIWIVTGGAGLLLLGVLVWRARRLFHRKDQNV